MHSSGHMRPQLTSQQIEATIPSPAPEHQVTRPDTLLPERLHFNYFEEDFLDAYFARNATPTYIHNMMDMGFSRAQINLALDRYVHTYIYIYIYMYVHASLRIAILSLCNV